ncbi:MAG: hypothetical protein HY985_17855 [Magnetospirillum sp.]|nr:hypothetical protein [Magnetospirillum sp.]
MGKRTPSILTPVGDRSFLGAAVPVASATGYLWVELRPFLKALPIAREIRRRIEKGMAGKSKGTTWLPGSDGAVWVRMASAEMIVAGLVETGVIADDMIDAVARFGV